MRVAICQLNSRDDKEQNLATAENLVREAAADRADLIALPEYTDYQGPKEGALASAEPDDGPTTRRFSALAAELGVNILLGSIRIQTDDAERCNNRSFLFDRGGKISAQYNKLHLYDVDLPGRITYRESDTVVPGDGVVMGEVDGHKAGLSICYDVRFPELFRLQALNGAEILFVPAAFALYTGRDHWEVLLRARAIENQCFVIAPGQFGPYPPAGACNGRSIIIDPWGNVLARMADCVGYAVADLDFSMQTKTREELPSLGNRRADMYDLKIA
ncbi:carbon-nitrogen hydrolase family protein [Thalassospira marina]|uniref:Hydrolase n=1 Tax=Thalassospira marina TaxID=2048283 RepID=A0A2N3KTE9_9PROT|nr:carbon-nitrogen hydrolase family protein [Thalassospira marina]PKR53790.1 hydrolase [Thalassospira marina]